MMHGFTHARPCSNGHNGPVATASQQPPPTPTVPPGLNYFQIKTSTDHLYVVWRRFKADRYRGDQYPTYIEGSDRRRLNKVYRALPEEFYTQTGLPVITPFNIREFLKHMVSHGHVYIFDLQEL